MRALRVAMSIDRAHLATIFGGQQVHQVTDRGMSAYKACVGKAGDAMESSIKDALGPVTNRNPDADGVRRATADYTTAVGNCVPELAK
jgi:hypothetical protein